MRGGAAIESKQSPRPLWDWIRSWLYRLDAETAHRWTVRWIRWAHRMGGRPLVWISGGGSLPRKDSTVRVFGVEFASRIGLAAGFDKNAEIISALPQLGFGFAEIGTVTPRPQPGHPHPRLFRDPARSSFFNRMGFNNDGAQAIADRLRNARASFPEGFRVGVNIGKGRDTSIENAAHDYRLAVQPFEGLVDFVVMNVSSPNTPGLRALQTVEHLSVLANAVGEELSRWSGSRAPLLLKLAPEVSLEDLDAILQAGPSWGISGWVLTNTLGGTWELKKSDRSPDQALINGGWSGAVLTELARDRLRLARSLTSMPLISVGGIMSVQEALHRVALGADLVQIYSGWIHHGPRFPRRIEAALQ